MRKHQTNLRQAEESSVPAQSFATPQDEIRHIRETDRTLAGFARVLEIIRDSDFFEVDQGCGDLCSGWLADHSVRCSGCVGTLLAWFFDEPDAWGRFRFENGAHALWEHLGLYEEALPDVVNRARRAAAGEGRRGYYYGDSYPFGSAPWIVDYAKVFKELARMHPGR